MEGYYFDEEKRASRGIGKDFLVLSLVVSTIVSLAIGFAAFKYFTYANLSAVGGRITYIDDGFRLRFSALHIAV